MKLGDVRSVDPEIVLVANPTAKPIALHRLGANLERHFGQYLLRQIEVLESILPALFIRPFGRAAFTRQSATLFQSNIFTHELLAVCDSFIVAVGQTLEEVRDVAAGGPNTPNDLEVS